MHRQNLLVFEYYYVTSERVAIEPFFHQIYTPGRREREGGGGATKTM